jgi:hypothetical protein
LNSQVSISRIVFATYYWVIWIELFGTFLKPNHMYVYDGVQMAD